jgi:DNA processing protein
MLTLINKDIPTILQHIPQPPKQLFVEGELAPLLARPRVAIVGTRKVSSYGRNVTQQLARELAEQGVVIVSGLGLGVDALAHQSAIEVGGSCIAVLPTSLDNIHPVSNRQLARHIVEQGGALLSEYRSGTQVYKKNFIERNRLVSGLSDGVLITEAALKSGTMHTANFALEQGKTVMAVPGNIDAAGSQGTNALIKTGASVVTETADVIHALGLMPNQLQKQLPFAQNADEQAIIDLLAHGSKEVGLLQVESKLTPELFNQTLTMLEINGVVQPLGAGQWGLRK